MKLVQLIQSMVEGGSLVVYSSSFPLKYQGYG